MSENPAPNPAPSADIVDPDAAVSGVAQALYNSDYPGESLAKADDQEKIDYLTLARAAVDYFRTHFIPKGNPPENVAG